MKAKPDEKLTLTDIAGGAAIEAVDDEIQNVIENILDPNCDPAKQRKVQLELTFMPTKDNPNLFGVAIQAKSKLVPANAVVTTAYADRDPKGVVCASELKPGMNHNQANMLDYEKDDTIDVEPVKSETVDPETGEALEETEGVIDFRKRAAGGGR